MSAANQATDRAMHGLVQGGSAVPIVVDVNRADSCTEGISTRTRRRATGRRTEIRPAWHVGRSQIDRRERVLYVDSGRASHK
jgi:hypothetical protein